MSKKARYILFGIAGVLILFILVGVFAGGDEEEGATAAATPTPQPAPTSTLAIPESTVTPVPTSTIPIPPTATASAKPTPTPEECPSSAEQAYFSEMSDNLNLMSRAAPEMSGLFTQAADNPRLFTSDDWKFNVAVQLGLMSAGSENILGMDPPPSVSSVSLLARRAAQDTRDAVDLYASGIDNLDPDDLLAANSLIRSASGYMTRMNEVLLAFCER